MANKTVEQILFDLDDHRMKRDKHFQLFDGPRRFIRLKKKGENKIIRSKVYSRFMDVVGKLSRDKEANRSAIHRFVNRLLTTRPMKYLRKNVHHLSISDFKKWFMDTWFYPLSDEPNDCMFKHVFCGKMMRVNRSRSRRFEGCHNWIEISVQERRIEYQEAHRFFISATATEKELLHVAEIRFKLYNNTGTAYYRRKLNTVFVGTSPAFDLALYSHIFKKNEPRYYRDRYEACIDGLEFDVIFNYRENRPSSAFVEME